MSSGILSIVFPARTEESTRGYILEYTMNNNVSPEPTELKLSVSLMHDRKV